jgi:hypothetical protein
VRVTSANLGREADLAAMAAMIDHDVGLIEWRRLLSAMDRFPEWLCVFADAIVATRLVESEESSERGAER